MIGTIMGSEKEKQKQRIDMSIRHKKQKEYSVEAQGNVLWVFTERWVWNDIKKSVDDGGNGPEAKRPSVYLFVRRLENGPYQFTRAYRENDPAANGALLWDAAASGWDVLRNPGEKTPKEFSPKLTEDEMRHEVIRRSHEIYPADQLEKIRGKLQHAEFVERRFRR